MMNNEQIHKDLKKYYQTNKKYFDHMANTHDAGYFESILRFLRDEKIPLKGKKVLDVGCGSGSLMKVLKQEFGSDFEAEGLDMSLLGNAEEWLHFTQGDAHNLPYEDNFFDVICIVDVLEHVVDPDKVLQEATRVLKPGGHLIIRTPNILSPILGHKDVGRLVKLSLGMKQKSPSVKARDLVPDLSEGKIGGDRDAISGIAIDQLLGELEKEKMKVLHFETWGQSNVRFFNHILLTKYLGSSITLLAQKSSSPK